MTESLRDLNTFPETQEYLRISKTKLHRMVVAGEIASVKVGDRRLFAKAAIEEFLARHTRMAK